eukprot:COSAG05_NODE_39_length_27555_cov_750.282925_2_plen_110_part_00
MWGRSGCEVYTNIQSDTFIFEFFMHCARFLYGEKRSSHIRLRHRTQRKTLLKMTQLPCHVGIPTSKRIQFRIISCIYIYKLYKKRAVHDIYVVNSIVVKGPEVTFRADG